MLSPGTFGQRGIPQVLRGQYSGGVQELKNTPQSLEQGSELTEKYTKGVRANNQMCKAEDVIRETDG